MKYEVKTKNIKKIVTANSIILAAAIFKAKYQIKKKQIISIIKIKE